LEQLLTRVEGSLQDGWKRNRQAEERFGRHGTRGPWDYCFSCTAKPGRPAAGLWIHARGPNELHVSTVVPLDQPRLTDEEVDHLLQEFDREFLGPAAVAVGVTTEIVRHHRSVEDNVSAAAVRLLRAFSQTANRAELGPADRQRWNQFLICIHQEESAFDPALLDEWLQREGWPADARTRLLVEHESAGSLLAAYDEHVEKR
jgi:hypothetical protein